MNKHTADRMQFTGRVGSHSTKPSARGVNLLGWEVPENLSPEEQRRAMQARVSQLNELFRLNNLQPPEKRMPKFQRDALGQEQQRLIQDMRAIRPTRRAPGVEHYLMDVARERLTKAEFGVWMTEAIKRWEAEHGTLPMAQEQPHA